MRAKKQLNLGQNISFLMKSRGITLSETARRATVSKTTLYNYSQDIVPKHVHSLMRLADFFDVTLDELLLKEPISPKTSSPLAGRYVLTIEAIHEKDDLVK